MELVEKLLKFFGGHVQIYQTDREKESFVIIYSVL